MGKGSFIRPGRTMRLVLVLAGALAASAAFAPAGQANFTTGRCLGSNITGRGASFAALAQAAWKMNFETNYCADVGSFPTVTYDPAGSGAGRRAMGERTGANADGSQSRNQGIRFGGTDEPPTPTAVSQMNQGTDTTGDEGTIHVVPAAVGSVTALVNFPDNCDRSLLPDASETDPASANSAPFLDRVRFTRAQFEEMWNGDSAHDQWTEIFPSLAGDPDCAEFITRVVRFDDSGTSFAFKNYLDKVNPGRNWDPGFTTGPDTRNWPNASIAARADCAGSPQGPTGTHLTSGCANGNGSLVAKLATVDGGVGYSDIATARNASPNYQITPGGSRDDDLFWTPLQNQSSAFVEPTQDANGYRSDGAKGANCGSATFNNIPASTLGDWQNTDATDSPAGYVICTLTYGLLFDDYKAPYSLEGGGAAVEEQRARSVKDYWQSIMSDDGQELLFNDDYAPVPPSILTISRQGVNQVCWDKAGTGACPVTRYFYPRPKGASPFYAQLVTAFNACTTPDRTHVAPLSVGSCNPPVPSSSRLTMGSPDANGSPANLIGSVNYKVTNPAGADNQDVNVVVNITDVRKSSDLTDYIGSLQVDNTIRLTDHSNGKSGGQGGTTTDVPFPITVPCVTTVSTTVGSTCSVTTTMNTIIGGSIIKEGAFGVYDLGQVKVNDGGPDNNGATTAGNDPFLRQGIFAP